MSTTTMDDDRGWQTDALEARAKRNARYAADREAQTARAAAQRGSLAPDGPDPDPT